ncbi:hypothetical protein [Lysinibacillus sp. BF-4]|uniref:hypothetical protein n=1 Tax=Lysinibacillus sp. BF-4 TaxID=1473546 RepID=UPI000A551A94|nr:hypothetical protein [Lysinibacillus sp. BF-4]
MIKEGVYIVSSQGDQTFLSPPLSGYGEIKILYSDFIPVSTKETKTMKLADTKKSKAMN